MSLSEAAPEGRLAGLVALRERLAQEIDGCESARDVAALSLRFMDVLVQIDELEGGSATASAPASPLDELRRKRAERSKTG
jgi:hypothetical protein